MKNVSKILLITLSNIGDAVITTAVLDALAREFPDADIDLFITPNVRQVFEDDARVHLLIECEKKRTFLDKIKLIKKQGAKKYDLIVDLKNTMLSVLLFPRYRTPIVRKKQQIHKKDEHLDLLKRIGVDISNAEMSITIAECSKNKAQGLLNDYSRKEKYIVVSPGSKSKWKRWPQKKYAALCSKIYDEIAVGIVLVGEGLDSNNVDSDAFICKYIAKEKEGAFLNLTGRTDLKEFAYLISKAQAVITNDSAALHFASAFNIPTIAIFGITDPKLYGPKASNSRVVVSDIACVPCKQHKCIAGHHDCMNTIEVDDVFNALQEVLI